MGDNPVSWASLLDLARIFDATPDAGELYVVGEAASRIRRSWGAEVSGHIHELVVTVGSELYDQWCRQIAARVSSDDEEVDAADGYRQVRLDVALTLLGISQMPLHQAWLTTLCRYIPLDVWFMPRNWRSYPNSVKGDLPYGDPDFVYLMAGDAVLIPTEGQSDWTMWRQATIRGLSPFP